MIQRRESRSAEELSNDISTGTDQLACIEETKDIGMEDEEDDEGQDTIVYNPLNLPLGRQSFMQVGTENLSRIGYTNYMD